jgi:DNA repair protein RadA/Sms
MKKAKTTFICIECGHESPKWLGRCPDCGEWDTIQEQTRQPDSPANTLATTIHAPGPLASFKSNEGQRLSSGITEFDRILGGGFVRGSLVLLGGEPGIGKSTILLQSLIRIASRGEKVLYASGEESMEQIKARAERLGACPESLWSVPETRTDLLMEMANRLKPDFIAVDSIQTMTSGNLTSAAGSISQIREATSWLMILAKQLSIPVIIVGHVTKDGVIAGPRALEHLVDCVLYFEGDRSQSLRMLRTVKNRYGPTFETGVFEMTDKGLTEVENPSALFMGNNMGDSPGSAVVPCMEGTRPILVEIQALVTQSYIAMPRRTSTGVDANRLALLVAVTEKHLHYPLYDKDIFINATGGLKITEPAADLGITASLISSLLEKPLRAGTAIFGEIGLTGEIRPVPGSDLRILEAERLGFHTCVTPVCRQNTVKKSNRVRIINAGSLAEAMEHLFET